jgi:hypothetical protein
LTDENMSPRRPDAAHRSMAFSEVASVVDPSHGKPEQRLLASIAIPILDKTDKLVRPCLRNQICDFHCKYVSSQNDEPHYFRATPSAGRLEARVVEKAGENHLSRGTPAPLLPRRDTHSYNHEAPEDHRERVTLRTRDPRLQRLSCWRAPCRGCWFYRAEGMFSP